MSARQRSALKLDQVGYWSEIKLEIVREYAKAYSTILSAQKRPSLYHVYIDAFAGAGVHLSRATGTEIEGSPLIAVNTEPPFKEYHFIDLDGAKIENLRSSFGQRPDIYHYHGDCNTIMLDEVLPRVRWADYRRGLCLLDPYGLHLNWEVIRTVGQSNSIDMFLNFPIADMNRNVFWRNPEGVDEADICAHEFLLGRRVLARCGLQAGTDTVRSGRREDGQRVDRCCFPRTIACRGRLQKRARAHANAKHERCDCLLLVLRIRKACCPEHRDRHLQEIPRPRSNLMA